MSRKGRAWRLVIALLLFITVMSLTVPLILAPLARSKLKSLVAEHLNAELWIGSLRYQFPYGVKAWDVHLISAVDHAEIFAADRVELSLVRLPIYSGPLLIKKISLKKPLLQLIHHTDGSLAGKNLVRAHPGDVPTSKKLSDILQLRELTIADGQVKYVDQSQADSLPMVWENLNAKLNLALQSQSQYRWDFSAASGPTAKIASAGTIDVDQAILDVSKFEVDANVSRGVAPSALPSQVQKLLREFDVIGTADFQMSGHLPLKEMPASQISATLKLKNAHADFGTEFVGDMELDIDKQPNNPQLRLDLKQLAAQTDAGHLDVSHLTLDIDSQTQAWQANDVQITIALPNHPIASGVTHLSGSMSGHGQTIEKYDMTAALDDLTFKPRALEQPMQHINGLLHAVDGKLTTGHINAVFGQDEFQLVSLTVPLDDVSKKIEFRDIALSINFHQPSPHYPNGLGRVIARLNPAGTYTLSGSYAIVYHGPNESNLVLTSDNSALAVGEQRMAITNLHADILLGPEQAQIRKFDGTLLGGTIAGTGMVGTRHPTQYDLNLTLRNIDMQQFSTAFALPVSNQAQLNGNADANLLFRGVEDDLNSISGRGDLRITDGQLWDMSLINGMASRTKIGRQALTAGEAAAMFEIANSQVQIIAAAINSPALGLEGNGTIGFDGKIDLNVIAAPFGDWEKEFKKTGIPIVSNIAGNVAGSIQKIVNSATSQLLYQFHVTGTISQPQVEAVPSPMLNDAGASIFEKMREKKESLLESLRQWRK